MKLQNFPSVNYPSLSECSERRAFMQNQFNKYGITKFNCFITEKFDKIKDSFVFNTPISIEHGQPGIIISFLNLLNDWYNKNEEEYAIFCDDDISFKSIEYWSFTWNEFVANLPNNWECVQLIRVNEWIPNTYLKYGKEEKPELKIRQRNWDDWGSSFVAKRSYVKKILERHYVDGNIFNLAIPDPDWGYLFPIIEHLLFRGLGVVYNFPLLVEETDLENSSSLSLTVDESILDSHRHLNKIQRTNSKNYYETLWTNEGLFSDIRDLMGRNPLAGIPSINVISLHECENRRFNLVSSLEKYNYNKLRIHNNHRYSSKLGLKIHCPLIEVMHDAAMGVTISHLNSIKYWYDNSDEPYAIFAEDDLKIDICNYWGFTFEKFISLLPEDWEAVQLIRIKNFHLGYDGSEGLNFRKREWDDWGCGAVLLSRSYAKKIINRHIKDDVYIIEVDNIHPMVENVMFANLGNVYNFPLFAEEIVENPKDLWEIERGIKDDHKLSSQLTINLWKQNNLSIEEIIGK